MKIYDISVPIAETLPVWPGDPQVSLQKASSIAAGDSCNVTRIVMGAHSGTHMDAPFHYLEQGIAIDAISLDACMGPCLVIEIDADFRIEKKDLEHHDLSTYARILLKTRNSRLWSGSAERFEENFVALGESAAVYFIEKKIRLVGIDYLSIEGFNSKDHQVHKTLLKSNIVILEGLDLSAVKPGPYELICLPLKISGADGAPARAVLREA